MSTRIEDEVIALLQKRSMTAMEILQSIRGVRPKTTKQAVYLAIRNLKKKEIITTHSKLVSLSRIWIDQMADFYTVARKQYARSAVADSGYLNLEEKDRITYSFKNPITTDVFWAHTLSVLAEITPQSEPVYIWNQHEWFFLAHGESERTLLRNMREKNKKSYVLSAHKDPLDRYVSNEFDGEWAQYYALGEQLFEKPNYYVNVVGDYILEVWLDKNVQNKIDAFYENHKLPTDEAIREIQKITQEAGQTKLRISKKQKKAHEIKNIFRKYFLVV